MDDGYRWITKNGNKIRIKTTNEYMNDYIRSKLKVVKDIENNEDKNYAGHLEVQKEDEYGLNNGKYQKLLKHDTYYQLDNGEKIEFLNKKEYKKMIDDFYNSLTQDEKDAINIWVGDPSFIDENPMFVYKKDYGKIMDNLFKEKAVTLDKDTLLFRRASDDYLDLQSGVNHEHALSTSAYDVIPKTLPSGIPFGSKELYIIAPKGTKVLPIEKVAVEMTNDDYEKRVYTRQHEIVLPKGTSYEMLEDKSTYYYRSPKSNEVYYRPVTEQQYVVKLTNKQYNKVDYQKPEHRFQWNNEGYENYIYKHKGQDIWIEEKNVSKSAYDNLERNKKSRKDVVKYRVSELAFKDKPEYYDTYEEAVKAIKKYL